MSLLIQTHSAGSSIEETGKALGMRCHKQNKIPPDESKHSQWKSIIAKLEDL